MKKSLKDFGYAFNSCGQLRKINANGELTDEPFLFNVSDKHQECQAHYEELGETITQYVYKLLEQQENLIKLTVPEGSNNETGTFIFASKDYDKKEKLIILIHGSGVVRAGQWSRAYGGVVVLNLANKLNREFENRVKAIALTDSVHIYHANLKTSEHLTQVSRNWVSSEDPLDTPQRTPEFDISKVSAGHPKHEMTSYSCIDSVFKFIENKLI